MAGAVGTKSLKFETLQLHAGQFEEPFDACSIPIYTSASFRVNASELDRVGIHGTGKELHIYSRVSNPTVSAFEKRMAALEGGCEAIAFSSGAAAVLMVIMTLARTGSNIISTESLHGGTYHQFKSVLPGIGVEARFIQDDCGYDAIAQLIDDNTKLIFAETIGNPRFTVADLELLSSVAHDHGIPLIVDSTFAAGGYFCRPFDHGADISIHSATKWISGHGTSLGGIVVDSGNFDWGKAAARFPQLHGARTGTKDLNLYETYGKRAYSAFLKHEVLRDTGACLGVRAAHDMLIGLETLSLRCERQAHNARVVAEWLQIQSQVIWLKYLGFEDHESHKQAKRYLVRGFGTVLTFKIHGGEEAALRYINHLRIIKHTANVGDSKTIIIHHWSTTHTQLTEAENHTIGVTSDLLRLSLGTEHVDDIIDDLKQAFEKMTADNGINGSTTKGH